MTKTKNENKEVIDRIIKTVSLKKEILKSGLEIIETGANLKLVCPFHGDTDPSMVLYDQDEKPHVYCFGCSKNLDVFWFIHELNKKKDDSWKFADTINYFSKNYKNLKIETSKLDLSFLDDIESKDQDVNMSELEFSIYLGISEKIRNMLSETKNTEKIISIIKPVLKNLDNAICANNKDSFEILKTVQKIIKDTETYCKENNILEKT